MQSRAAAPGATSRSRMKLRAINPDAATRTMARATCATTNALRARCLRTLDVDFAVHIAHTRSQLRADLKQLITGLGFTDYLAAEGVQKFTGGGYEVEFIGQRSGGRNKGFLSVPEWNVTAIPLPFINIMMDFSDVAELDGFTIRFPVPEAYFLHKLIIARKRQAAAKRGKDIEQCAVIMKVINDDRMLQVTQAQRFGKETRRHIAASCGAIGFPLHRIGLS